VSPARRWLVASALGAALAVVAVQGPVALAQGQGAPAQDWKKEFEEVCAKTQDAMALPVKELETLVARCDRLKPAIEKLDESQRKVYARRLKVCRDLYQFVIDSRVKE
jgi:hypothetical protein